MKQLAILVAKEIGIIVLIGAVPVFYAFLWAGADIKEQFLLKLVVDSRVAWFVAGCATAFLTLAWIERWFVTTFDALHDIATFFIHILLDSALILAGLLRIIAGILIGFLVLSWMGGVDVIGTIKMASFATTAGISLLAGFVIARLALFARARWRSGNGAPEVR